jgi:hypothetical protein
VTGTEPPELRNYTVGVPLWHPIEDVRSLLMYRRRGDVTVGAWLRSLLKRQRFALWRLDDPGPTFHSFAVKVRRRYSKKPITASATSSVEAAADGSRSAVRS